MADNKKSSGWGSFNVVAWVVIVLLLLLASAPMTWAKSSFVGATGPKGETGVQGVQGLQGLEGLQGLRGLTGAQGEQGLKGDTGAQGIAGPVGPQGPQGEVGPQGNDGAILSYIVTNTGSNSGVLSAGTLVSADATCYEGSVLTGGGAYITTTGNKQNFVLRNSYPSAADTWTAEAVVSNTFAVSNIVTVTSYAICNGGSTFTLPN